MTFDYVMTFFVGRVCAWSLWFWCALTLETCFDRHGFNRSALLRQRLHPLKPRQDLVSTSMMSAQIFECPAYLKKCFKFLQPRATDKMTQS